MNLNEKNQKIFELKNKVEYLEKKRNAILREINKMEEEYYYEYFDNANTEKWLTNIPDYQGDILNKYSVLNVDEVARIICDLFKKENDQNYNIKRIAGGEYNYSYCLIGSERRMNHRRLKEGINCDKIYINNRLFRILSNANDSILIGYDKCKIYKLCDYPTTEPIDSKSNYNNLLYDNELKFNYKNYEFIKELIFSLANYQRVNDIKYMTAEETNEAYKKLYLTK